MFLVVDPPEVAGRDVGGVDGYWDAVSDDTAPGFLEQLPEGLTLPAAIEWARQRSGRIVVRNDDPAFPMPTGRSFWAGDDPCPPDAVPMP